MEVPFDPDDVERQDEVARRLLATAARIRTEQQGDERRQAAQTQQLPEPVDWESAGRPYAGGDALSVRR